MTDKEKQEAFIKYKIKSNIIKYGWYTLYIVLFFLLVGFYFNKWLFLGMILCLYPVWLMIKEIKPLRKELKAVRNTPPEEKKDGEQL